MVRTSRSFLAPAVQALLGASVLLLVLAPPARGAMLAVPVAGAVPLPTLIAAGAQPLGAGPVAGSIVLRGSRGAVWRAAMGSGALLVAWRGGCGEFGEGR